MKILLVTDQHIHLDGDNILGSSNFTSNLKKLSLLGELYLCAIECKDTKRSIVIFNDRINEYIKKDNIAFIKKSFIWPSADTQNKIKEQISKVDLVVGYVPALNAEVANIYAKKAGKKFFSLMVACPWDGLWNQDLVRKFAAPYRFLLNRYVLRHSDYALYVTNHFLQKRYPTRGKSIGVSDVVIEKSNTNILESRIDHINQLHKDSIIKIATTAMLNVKYKGQRFVIHAIKKLKDLGYRNYEYYLIGGGDSGNLHNLAKKLGVESQIHFVGKVTHDKVFNILDEMDIYIHPSLQEGMPRSVVEAMSRGLPCIGARTAAIPELIDNDFVTRRKSVEDIVTCILKFRDKRILMEQAKRNFEESKKYECSVLDSRRSQFYHLVRTEIENYENICR